MCQPIISVIIPVYNAVKYLEKSLSSVQKQSLKEIEIIIVDDGSKDGSSELCDSLAAYDNRIKVIHQANGGASAARNAGIKLASGKYLAFMDADDYIEADIYEKCYEIIRKTDADCIKFGVIEEYYDQGDKLLLARECSCEDGVYEGQKAVSTIAGILEQKPLFGYTCNAIYNKYCIANNNIYYNLNLKVNEDFEFNIRYFKYVNKLVCVNECAYHYVKRNQGSLSSQSSNYSYYNHMLKINGLLHMLENSDNCTKENLQRVFWLYTRFVYSSLSNGEDFSVIKEDILFNRYKKISFKGCPLKQRILVWTLMTENVFIINSFAHSMSFVKKYLPVIFARVKG